MERKAAVAKIIGAVREKARGYAGVVRGRGVAKAKGALETEATKRVARKPEWLPLSVVGKPAPELATVAERIRADKAAWNKLRKVVSTEQAKRVAAVGVPGVAVAGGVVAATRRENA